MRLTTSSVMSPLLSSHPSLGCIVLVRDKGQHLKANFSNSIHDNLIHPDLIIGADTRRQKVRQRDTYRFLECTVDACVIFYHRTADCLRTCQPQLCMHRCQICADSSINLNTIRCGFLAQTTRCTSISDVSCNVRRFRGVWLDRDCDVTCRYRRAWVGTGRRFISDVVDSIFGNDKDDIRISSPQLSSAGRKSPAELPGFAEDRRRDDAFCWTQDLPNYKASP